jgi:hypothetical protein
LPYFEALIKPGLNQYIGMSCLVGPKFFTANGADIGLKSVGTNDGYTINLSWYKSYVNPPTGYQVFYNIYFSNTPQDVFSEGVKFVSNSVTNFVKLQDAFKMGDMYYFAVRSCAFENSTFDYNDLPGANPSLKIYPETLLSSDITSSSTNIPVIDASIFPPYGLLKLGREILFYTSKDNVNNTLMTSIPNRGMYGTPVLPHNTDGYDGYQTNSPIISLFKGFEDNNHCIAEVVCKGHDRYIVVSDGYKTITDLTSGFSNLQIVDNANAGFPAYDYAGYHRTDPRDLLAGKINSYIGGEQGCAASDNSFGPTRGQSVQDSNTQRQEMLLNSTGEPVCLFRRNYDGVASKYYDISRENTTYRGIDGNFSTATVNAYTQWFSDRRADGKIMIRIPATKENVKRNPEGLENEYISSCWSIVYPELKDGDFFIRFNSDLTPEFRYEIVNTERNRMFLQESGAQKFTAIRIRLTDPIYQVKALYDTSSFPSEVLTSLSSAGKLIPLHLHRVVLNGSSIANLSQTTSSAQGHNHTVFYQNGQLVVQEVLGHTHTIIL